MMKRLNKKENLGITLIALVITIVILIILAGIIINVSLSDNGIFKKAKEASELSSISKYKEQIELVRTAKQMEKQGNATLEDLNVAFNDLNEKYWVNNAEIENGVIKLITNDGYLFFVTENMIEYKGNGDIIVPEVITAEMLEFTPKDTSWKALDGSEITNVKQALDSLYGN